MLFSFALTSVVVASEQKSDQTEQGIDQALAPIRAQAQAIAQRVEGQPLPVWLQVPEQTGMESSVKDHAV
ncbi:hypothetical protein U5801_29685, partial [Lamprobacter modestohalophilus]|uniref:hypothetical protein n=1 Tax=Lamprobacter modestohalophilus TaxID=1064514 RepID=UPI002ADED992